LCIPFGDLTSRADVDSRTAGVFVGPTRCVFIPFGEFPRAAGDTVTVESLVGAGCRVIFPSGNVHMSYVPRVVKTVARKEGMGGVARGAGGLGGTVGARCRWRGGGRCRRCGHGRPRRPWPRGDRRGRLWPGPR